MGGGSRKGASVGGGEACEEGVGVGDDVGVGYGEGGFREHVDVDEAGVGVEEAGSVDEACGGEARDARDASAEGALAGRREPAWCVAAGRRLAELMDTCVDGCGCGRATPASGG